MRRALIWIIGLSMLAGAALAQQGWSTFSPEGGRYRVDLPGAPMVATTNVSGAGGTAPLTEAVVQGPGVTYRVSYIDYPDRVAGAHSSDVLLDRARDGMASGHTIRDQQKLTLGRAAGRAFVIVDKTGATNAVRLYWARNRLYTLAVTGRPGIESQPDTQRFFDSFSIIRPSST